MQKQTEKREKIHALEIICQQLLSNLNTFPSGELHFGQRPQVTWNDEDLSTLKLLLYNLWGDLKLTAKDTTGIVGDLHWISETVHYLRGVPSDSRQEYDMFYRPKLQSKISQARQGLEKVVASCQQNV